MSFLISLRGISKNSLSPTRCTANMPRRVIASDVITRLYGRGAAAPVAPPAPPRDAESPAPCVPAGPEVGEGRAPPDGEGAAGGVAARAQPPTARTERRATIFYCM